MKLPDLNELYYFAQVVEHGGFAPAGRALGLPKSKLSRRVALLEERLGAQLLLRSTRSFAVTEVGKRYYQHCRAMLTEAEAAEESVAITQSEPCGLVRLSCPVALLASRVGHMLAAFMQQHPRVQLQVDETNRRVDVVAEGLDGEVELHQLVGKDKLDLSGYDRVVLGSSVRIGSFLKPAKQFMETYGDELMQKKLGLFLCCGAPHGGDKYFGLSVPEDLLHHASVKEVFGGEMLVEKMSFLDRMMIKMNKNPAKPQIYEESVRSFIAQMNAL